MSNKNPLPLHKYEGSDNWCIAFRALQVSQELDANKIKKTLSETNIVARVMAKRELADIYLSENFEHMQCRSWWEDKTLYHAFMFLLSMRYTDKPSEWSKEMVKLGKSLLAAEASI